MIIIIIIIIIIIRPPSLLRKPAPENPAAEAVFPTRLLLTCPLRCCRAARLKTVTKLYYAIPYYTILCYTILYYTIIDRRGSAFLALRVARAARVDRCCVEAAPFSLHEYNII